MTQNLAKLGHQGKVTSGRRHPDLPSEREHQSARLAKELRRLYDILESYAPQWYTQEHHERAESALRQAEKASADVFVQLCKLLEEYAPAWYTKEYYGRDKSVLELLREN